MSRTIEPTASVNAGGLLNDFNSYAQMSLAAAMLSVPLVFWRRSADVFGITKLTVIWLATLTALALYLAWPERQRQALPSFNLAWAAIAFFAAFAIATIFAGSPVLSALGLPNRLGGLVSYGSYVLFFLVLVAVHWRTPSELSLLVQSTMAGASVVAIYILFQVLGYDRVRWVNPSTNEPFKYPIGSLGNSNFAGGVLGIAIPLAVWMFIVTKGKAWKIALGALVAINLLALWFTQSRGGMSAALAGLAVMAFSMRDRLPKLVQRLIPIGAIAGLIIAILVLFHPGTERPIGPLAKLEVFRTETFENRTNWWKAAILMFNEDPITGQGLDHFHLKYAVQRSADNLEVELVDKPHNIFLEFLAGTGLVGFGAFMSVVGLGLWYGYREARRAENADRLLTASFLGVLTGYLAQGIFSIDLPPIAIMGWLALGGIAVLADPKLIKRRATAFAGKPASEPQSNEQE